jgi:uncharacterized protein (TIGR02145 family)
MNTIKLLLCLIISIYFTQSCKEKKEDDYPSTEYSSISDIEGITYKTVKIGAQWWMAENLKSNRYRDGTIIPNVTDNADWSQLTTGAYCFYKNLTTYQSTYGTLYNWYAVNTGKLCPAGWHVHTDAEWNTLYNFLGGLSVAGGKMKSFSGWNSPNKGATNSSGFSGLPGGYRNNNGTFYNIEFNGFWWSSTEYSATNAWSQHLSYGTNFGYRDGNYKELGLSVRCIRDF